MSNNNKLSHSSTQMYQSCPKKYYYHYKAKYRAKETSAALLWGSAIDTALNYLLSDINRQRVDYLGQEYIIQFTAAWRKSLINRVETELHDCEDIVYAAADFDPELIPYNDLMAAHAKVSLGGIYYGIGVARNPEDCYDIYENIKRLKEAKGWANLQPNERKFYNYLNWLSMHAKGAILIKSYIEQIVPRIKKVLSGQKEINLTTDDGDSITGFIDAVLEWEDGRVVVFDHKTAAREYEWDAVLKSAQLALYVHAVEDEYKTRHAGYIVLRKNIDKNRTKVCTVCKHDGGKSRAKTCDNEINAKRCGAAWTERIDPKGRIDVLINEMPKRVEEIVLDNFVDINAQIKTGIFPRNLGACVKPFPCQFYDICWGNDASKLVKMEDK